MSKDGITIIERYQKGYLTAFSIDEGETYHPSVRQAFEHQAEGTDLKLNDSDTTANGTSESPITTPRRPHE